MLPVPASPSTPDDNAPKRTRVLIWVQAWMMLETVAIKSCGMACCAVWSRRNWASVVMVLLV